MWSLWLTLTHVLYTLLHLRPHLTHTRMFLKMACTYCMRYTCMPYMQDEPSLDPAKKAVVERWLNKLVVSKIQATYLTPSGLLVRHNHIYWAGAWFVQIVFPGYDCTAQSFCDGTRTRTGHTGRSQGDLHQYIECVGVSGRRAAAPRPRRAAKC